jgi:hypothetical protein
VELVVAVFYSYENFLITITKNDIFFVFDIDFDVYMLRQFQETIDE